MARWREDMVGRGVNMVKKREDESKRFNIYTIKKKL
jgi:hypothetical protein